MPAQRQTSCWLFLGIGGLLAIPPAIIVISSLTLSHQTSVPYCEQTLPIVAVPEFKKSETPNNNSRQLAPMPHEAPLNASEITEPEADLTVPDLPPKIGMPEIDLDKLVEKGAAREPVAKGKVDLTPIDRKAAIRKPALVAADVDALIDRKLAGAGIPISPPADDAEFLRRLYLD